MSERELADGGDAAADTAAPAADANTGKTRRRAHTANVTSAPSTPQMYRLTLPLSLFAVPSIAPFLLPAAAAANKKDKRRTPLHPSFASTPRARSR